MRPYLLCCRRGLTNSPTRRRSRTSTTSRTRRGLLRPSHGRKYRSARALLPRSSHCAAHPVTGWQFLRRREWNTSSPSSARWRPVSSPFRSRRRNTVCTTTGFPSVLRDSQPGRHSHDFGRGRRRHEIRIADTTGNPPRSSSRSTCWTWTLRATSHPVGTTPPAPAYLQYTSGSTRTPAGVIVSHKNVIANVTQSMYAYFGDPARLPADLTADVLAAACTTTWG